MNRRGFLAALIGGATLDPERLLWRPGAKLISIPTPRPVQSSLRVGSTIAIRIPEQFLSPVFYSGQHAQLAPMAWATIMDERELLSVRADQVPDSMALRAATLAAFCDPGRAGVLATSPHRLPNPPNR